MNEIGLKLAEELETTQHEFWNISRQTAEFISMLIKIHKPQRVLEVGTSNGYSALWIADSAILRRYRYETNEKMASLATGAGAVPVRRSLRRRPDPVHRRQHPCRPQLSHLRRHDPGGDY